MLPTRVYKVDDIADELLNLMKSESCAIYETTEQFRQNPLSPAGLVEKLNDKVVLPPHPPCLIP